MTNAAQDTSQPVHSSHRTLVIVALVTVCVAALLNVWLMTHGRTVQWFSWAFLCGLACSTGAVAMRSRAMQNLLMALAFILVIAAVYGIARR